MENKNKPSEYTLAFIDIKGDAGQLTEPYEWKLRQRYKIKREYFGRVHGRYFSLAQREDGWYVIGHPGLVWDYATGWFDYDAIKEASLVHDILHWLIRLGIIAVRDNDKIDQEFYLVLRYCGVPKWRARLLRRGTSFVDEKETGQARVATYLNKGKRVG